MTAWFSLLKRRDCGGQGEGIGLEWVGCMQLFCLSYLCYVQFESPSDDALNHLNKVNQGYPGPWRSVSKLVG